MVYILISLIFFLITIIGHILVHKLLVKMGKVTFKSVAIFVVGFLVNSFIIFFLDKRMSFASKNILVLPVPFTAVFLYGIMVLVFIALFTGPFWGEESPSTKIFLFLKKTKSLNLSEILKRFSDEELVLKRLDDMLGSGWIKLNNNRYTVLPSGRMIIRFIYFYRKLLGWKLIG